MPWLGCGTLPPVALLLAELEVGSPGESSNLHSSSKESSSPTSFVTDIGTHEKATGSVKTVVVLVNLDVTVRVDVSVVVSV